MLLYILAGFFCFCFTYILIPSNLFILKKKAQERTRQHQNRRNVCFAAWRLQELVCQLQRHGRGRRHLPRPRSRRPRKQVLRHLRRAVYQYGRRTAYNRNNTQRQNIIILNCLNGFFLVFEFFFLQLMDFVFRHVLLTDVKLACLLLHCIWICIPTDLTWCAHSSMRTNYP